MKKFTCIFIMVILLLGTFQSAFAAPRIPVYKVGNVIYFFDKSSGTITGFAGEPTDLIIPTTINGYHVVSIGTGAFNSSPTLRTLSIPDGISSISANAFANCSNLTSVEIGATVSFIGDSAFANCTSLSNVIFHGFLDNIEPNAFYATAWITSSQEEFVTLGRTTLIKYNGNAEKVVVPDGIRRIEASAFAGNTTLKEVVLPYGLEKIGDNAFVHCYSLEKIDIPSTVAYIGAGAFDDTIWLSRHDENFISVNGILISYRGNDRNVSVPYGITGIGSGAFMSNENVVCVNIPETVLYIDSLAFLGCSNLLCVNVPASVEWIDEYAFSGCVLLSLNTAPYSYAHQYAQYMEIITTTPTPVFVGANQIVFSDAYPVILNGTTYVPMRAVLEALGFSVQWDSATGNIKCTKGYYSSVIESDGTILINGTQADFKAETISIDGRTLYPARTLAKIANANIEWNAELKSVIYSL